MLDRALMSLRLNHAERLSLFLLFYFTMRFMSVMCDSDKLPFMVYTLNVKRNKCTDQYIIKSHYKLWKQLD